MKVFDKQIASPDTKAGAITFSLPVSEFAGFGTGEQQNLSKKKETGLSETGIRFEQSCFS